jgi:hypothetical protein
LAETDPNRIVRSPFTLRELIEAVYRGPFADRFQNAERDVKRRVTVETILQWKVKYAQSTPNYEKVHTYRIRVISVKEDGTVSNYPVTILLQSLSVDAPVKVRCGGLQTYTGHDTMKDKKICGDFYFRFQNVLKRYGVLYDRDSTNKQFPYVMNPQGHVGICKHILGAIADLVSSDFLNDASPTIAKESKKFVKQYF